MPEPPLPGPSDEDYLRAAALRHALRRFLRRSEQVSRAHGLTPQRYLLLLMIRGTPGGGARSTVGELAVRMHLAQNTVTDLVARAEAAGLVRREPAEHDARSSWLEVTREGERRLGGAVADLGAERAALIEALAHLED